MKRKVIVSAAALLAVLIGVLVYDWVRVRDFKDICPSWDWVSVRGTLYEVPGQGGVPFTVDAAALRETLMPVQVKKAEKTKLLPDPALQLWVLLLDGSTLDLTIGGDGALCCAQVEDLSGTRTYWSATDKTVYTTVYALGEIGP